MVGDHLHLVYFICLQFICGHSLAKIGLIFFSNLPIGEITLFPLFCPIGMLKLHDANVGHLDTYRVAMTVCLG